ncbi:formimidoylglutamase [Myroides pelagicus]|uniref:formimidoylglutamase n=1 Tax=Myroides pelagicus TaxID=270914 RepID=UPI002DBA857D|nr:formimidoylglutamase [Myroides pelagicus]MEC4113824.1 formimidoylglutamase [Myroides pelagicus]
MPIAKLKVLSKQEVINYTNFRHGEIKFGEKVQLLAPTANWEEELKLQETKYVVLGIPEDIGVKANFGRPGTNSAWESFLSAFLNIQHNRFCKGSWVTVLGHLDFEKEIKEANDLNPSNKEHRKRLFELVQLIDKEVSHIVTKIVRAGKLPIIVGGGHNNAYGNIKGSALAKGKAINAINFDAHTDFRPLEGRHSGNGFSYAFEEGFLKNYFIFGLHENYTSKSVFMDIKANAERVKYNTFEQMNVRGEKSFETELNIAQKHIEYNPYGIEIDLDAIRLVASSAITPTGFATEKARQFIHFFGKSKNATYLHICEGAPTLDYPENKNLVGKLISFLVTDFIKANNEKI